MLAYVYGVVPISLCRSGGCGVSAGNGKGVRIEFDDENDINVGGTNTAIGESFCQIGTRVFIVPSSFLGSLCSTQAHTLLLLPLSPSLSSLTLRQGLTL